MFFFSIYTCSLYNLKSTSTRLKCQCLYFSRKNANRQTHRQNDYRTLLPTLRGEGNDESALCIVWCDPARLFTGI